MYENEWIGLFSEGWKIIRSLKFEVNKGNETSPMRD